MEEKNSYSQP